jgi:hypothetical protein
MSKIILILISLFFYQENRAQSDPARMFENLFASIQKSDSANFIKLHAGDEQRFQIVKGILFRDMNMDSVKLAEITPNSRKSDSFFIAKLLEINKQSDSLGFKFIHSTYVDCRYHLVKDPGNFFLSLSGDIIFKNNGDYYLLPVNEAILIAEKWKIISTGSISQIKDSSFLYPKKVSALQTIEKETKISQVRMTVAEEQDEPPPPPPPKIIKSKPKSKNK